MGYTVAISNYRRYFKLAAYLSTFTQEAIVIAMGVPTLRELFRESHYTDLDGGLLEGFGRLLKFDLKIYVYPTVDPKTGELISASNLKVGWWKKGGVCVGEGFCVSHFFFPLKNPLSPPPQPTSQVDPHVQKLYDYILERGTIVPVIHFDRELLRHGDVSKLVAESIRAGTRDWEVLVPHHVRDQIKALNLLGHQPRKALAEGNGVAAVNGAEGDRGAAKKAQTAGAA